MTMHSAKGLEFPVVFLAAMEQGLIPHERSLSKEDEVEEERRLCFVGMTRAREELYLTHARTREFRGQTLNAIPSMFLEELPRDGLERADHSTGASASDHWRSGSAAAEHGWHEAGVRPKPRPIKPADLGLTGSGPCPYVVGMLVKHQVYGDGRVIEVSGHGLLTRVKVRFRTAGERSFIADKVKLEIVK
jgi:DNA helicase-2/ATP-dependent DNA helicase PcrA